MVNYYQRLDGNYATPGDAFDAIANLKRDLIPVP